MKNTLRALLLFPLLSHSAGAAAATAECWARAAGSAPRTIQREATFAMGGLQGTIRTFSRGDGAYWVETAIPAAGYRSVQIYDGRRGWRADGASAAHEVTALELEDLVTSSVFDRLQAPAAAVPADAPNTFTVTPPGGNTATVVLDAETCLPRTVTRTRANEVLTLTFEEWIDVDGRALPARVKQSNGNGQFDATVRFTSTKLNEEIADALFAPPGGARFASLPAAYLELPFELTQNHVYVTAELAGKKTSFALDTGAEATVVDREYAAALGLAGSGSIQAVGGGEGSMSAQVIAKPELRLASVPMPIATMYAIPLRALWSREGRRMEGVLGHDVLSHFVVEIDYAASRVRLHDPERFSPPSGATSLPMTFDGNIPAVRATFELPGGRKVEGRMIVDTGNSGGIDLAAPFVEANGIRASVGRVVEGAGGLGVGGVAKQDLARIAAFHLGPYKLSSPIVSLSRDTKGAAAHPELAGNLGGRVLRRFRVFVDYPHNRFLLQPNAFYDAPFEIDMSGLALVADGDSFDRIVVRRVLPQTAAADAGLREGDEIAAIDGAKLSVHRIRELFLRPDATYDLRVKRGSETLAVRLSTRRVI